MYLRKLELINYRNHKALTLELNQRLNIILGKNAQGKTNILEAIYFLATGTSCQTNLPRELINWENKFVSIKGLVFYQGREVSLAAAISYKPTSQAGERVLAPVYTRSSSSLLKVVLFSPDDITIIKGEPEERRSFLDEFGSQVSAQYRHWRRQYGRILKHRNALLKTLPEKPPRGAAETIEAWNERLVEAGARLLVFRENLVKKLNHHSSRLYAEISPGTALSIKYVSNVGALEDKTLETVKAELKEAVQASLAKDIERGITLVGPHRDDLIFLDGEINLRSFGSQGEQRTAALSLKLAELEILGEEIGEPPVLLLDDVMSELDASRREKLMERVRNGAQAIITSTNPGYFEEFHLKEASVFEIKGKMVERLL